MEMHNYKQQHDLLLYSRRINIYFTLHVSQYGKDGSIFHVCVCCIYYLLIQVPLDLIHLFVYIVNSTNRIGGLIVNLQASS
jgi:hypothetical protein